MQECNAKRMSDIKEKMAASFLRLRDFEEYLVRLEEFIGLTIEKATFRKEMELMETDQKYTHRRKDQLREKKKREIVKRLHGEIDTLCDEIMREGVYTPVYDSDDFSVNIVYVYPDGKREDINHAIAKRTALSIETEGDICFASFPAKAVREIDLILFPVKNVFSGYDYLKMGEDAAASWLYKVSRIFRIEHLMWQVNYLIPEYRSLRSIGNTRLRNILKAHHDSIASERNEIYEGLIKEGNTHAVWISEQKAYAIVKEAYPDAKFQYQPEWLHGQRLDIFIPSENAGIEYQGKQHSEAVDFFGGDDGLKYTVQKDRRKNYLCRINGVKLIYWDYDTPLTKEYFDEYLKPKIKGR